MRTAKRTPYTPDFEDVVVAKKHQLEPIKIQRSVDQQGATYALDPSSVERLKRESPEGLHVVPRLFIAHETAADYNQIRADLKAQIAHILTGLSEDNLGSLAPIVFVDPVSEKQLASWSPARP